MGLWWLFVWAFQEEMPTHHLPCAYSMASAVTLQLLCFCHDSSIITGIKTLTLPNWHEDIILLWIHWNNQTTSPQCSCIFPILLVLKTLAFVVVQVDACQVLSADSYEVLRRSLSFIMHSLNYILAVSSNKPLEKTFYHNLFDSMKLNIKQKP